MDRQLHRLSGEGATDEPQDGHHFLGQGNLGWCEGECLAPCSSAPVVAHSYLDEAGDVLSVQAASIEAGRALSEFDWQRSTGDARRRSDRQLTSHGRIESLPVCGDLQGFDGGMFR
ncbi:hypothetical protein ACWD0G_07645 [Streptomyces goshikiensis]